MIKFFQKLFDIREGEGLKASLMFVYIFFVIASLLIVKPVRNSLFLIQIGVARLPYAFVLVAISAAVVINFYSKFARKVRLNLLIFYTMFISITMLFFFWMLIVLNYQASWFYYLLYIWVALFGVITTSQFWLLANYVFNAREAKRLFGFIGAGAISGGIFGGYLTKFLAPIIGTENMIFFCIGFLSLCIIVSATIWKKSARLNYTERLLQEKRIRKTLSKSPIKLFLKSKHLTFMATIVGIGVIVANLVDFQFSAIASKEITNEDQLTAFFGFWLSNLSIASLLIQLFLTGRILKSFGVTTSLFFLPVVIFFGALCILVNPVLWSAVLIKVSDGGFKQSLNKAGLELLALPIPSELKNQAKAFIDVFVDSLATGIGGLLLIVFTQQLGFLIRHISFIIIGLIGFWLYLVTRVKGEYINSFRMALEKRSIDLRDQNINLEDASVFDSLIKVLDGNNERQILYVLQLIENIENEDFIPYFAKLIRHPSYEIKIQVLKIISQYEKFDFTKETNDLVYNENYDVKVEAIRYLYKRSKNGGEELRELLSHPDIRIRGAALRCAAYEHRDQKEFRETMYLKQLINDFIEQCYQKDCDEEEKEFMKINLATVIGITREPELYPFLQNLLHDNSLNVVRAAIKNAGATRDPEFVPILIRHLNTNIVRSHAREALSEFGDDIIDILDEYLINPKVSRRIRLGIPKVLALIGTQNSVNLLFNYLDQSDLTLRFEIIRALNRIRKIFPFIRFDEQSIQRRIIKETEKYFKTLSILYTLNNHSINSEGERQRNLKGMNNKRAGNLLITALEERLDYNLDRIFRLLGLKYCPDDMYNAYKAVTSQSSDLRAKAVEFLDNILDPHSKRMIIPIIERYSSKVQVSLLTGLTEMKHNSQNEALIAILEEDDNWLKVCALYFMAESGITEPSWMIKKLATDPDPITRETAEYSLRRLGD